MPAASGDETSQGRVMKTRREVLAVGVFVGSFISGSGHEARSDQPLTLSSGFSARRQSTPEEHQQG